MTNFELVTQNEATLEQFISAVVDDALEAKGCSVELKLPGDFHPETDIYFGWAEWLKEENRDNEILLPNGRVIEKWGTDDG